MKKNLYYLPRILAVLVTLFFSLFILEGFGPGFGWQDSLIHFLLALVLLGTTVLAWRQPKVGGPLFTILGIGFMIFFHPFWWNGLLIGGVPLLSGLLFLSEQPK